MKKIVLTVALILMCSVAFASDISLEPLLNRVYDTDAKTIRVSIISQDTKAAATNTRSTLTANSYDTIVTANVSRRYLSISIISHDNVFVNLESGGDAIKGEGFLISPDTMWIMPAGAIYTGSVSATSSITGSAIGIIEY